MKPQASRAAPRLANKIVYVCVCVARKAKLRAIQTEHNILARRAHLSPGLRAEMFQVDYRNM